MTTLFTGRTCPTYFKALFCSKQSLYWVKRKRKNKTCFKDLKHGQKGAFFSALAVLRLNASLGFSELSTLSSGWIFSEEFVLQKCSQERSVSTPIFMAMSIFEAFWNYWHPDYSLLLDENRENHELIGKCGMHTRSPNRSHRFHWIKPPCRC